LDSLLNEGDEIHFAPSGLLHRIALSAIPCGDTEQLLSDRYKLNRLSTTAKLVTDRDKKEKRPEEIVLFGGIDYDLRTKANRTKNEGEVYVSRALPMDLDRGNASWSYLPGTLKETETIAGTQNIKVKTYTGADATEEQIKALGGKGSPTVLHIASHGFFFSDPDRDLEQERMMQMMSDRERVYRYSDDPLNRAGLLFSGANHTWQNEEVPDGREDGILTANEATYIPLINTELVVLSACETGLGEIKGSEGVFGLQRAFKAAGAEYVMMSLWKVPDQETSEFMESFYGQYLSDHTIPDSYHHAQRVMREKYPNDPYKWAGFVLMR
jgi:CHAT domain-containing protein